VAAGQLGHHNHATLHVSTIDGIGFGQSLGQDRLLRHHLVLKAKPIM